MIVTFLLFCNKDNFVIKHQAFSKFISSPTFFFKISYHACDSCLCRLR